MVKGVDKSKVLRRDALPVPENLPMGTRCIQVTIPDDDEYLRQFYSIATLLTKWNSYAQDGGHKAADVAYIWKQALRLQDCETGETFDGVFVEDCMGCGFRINPENNCEMQIWCNGEWETFWDISSCVTENVKQFTNGEALEPGDCREWDVSLRANDKWLIPVSLNSGDTVEITNVSGAWNSGGLIWNCPNGQLYALGECSGSGSLDAGNPAPLELTMALLLNIDDTFFLAYNNTVAVPDDTSDVQCWFQANDANIYDNSGTITFHVKVCSLATVPETITITYDSGTGLTTLPPNQNSWIVSMTSADVGGSEGNWLSANFSTPVKITVQSVTGFVNRCSGACLYTAVKLGGSIVQSLNEPSPPTSMTPALTGDAYGIASGNNGGTPTDYVVQLLIERV